MELNDRNVLVLGGAGLVGLAVARRMLEFRPRRMALGALTRDEAERGVEELREEAEKVGVEVVPVWGDLFVPEALKDRPREEVLSDPDARARLVDDLFGELTPDVVRRSALGALILETRPSIIIDCVNTAGALAYRDAFASAQALREQVGSSSVDTEDVERHLATLYLPQLIRHVQVALDSMRRVGTDIYVKIGTAGTGGMGLNIPFTHSEERPSRVLLAKSGLAGAQTLLLYLMARSPDAPAVKEIKPTAAISWKAIRYGPVSRGGRPIVRYDATEPVEIAEVDGDRGRAAFRSCEEVLSGVYLDAGENGLFSISEFETLTALGLMEFVTPEEIADSVIREVRAHPTGKDIVAALDAATLGPTYRAGVLRSAALETMERLESESGVEAVAYEMLGPPRLSKLLFEAAILRRLYETREAAAELDPAEAAERAEALLLAEDDLRQRILSIGIPILLSDGKRALRGPQIKAPAIDDTLDPRALDRGWVDLRQENWSRWRERIRRVAEEISGRPGPEEGSRGDYQYGDNREGLRPGRLAAWVFRTEDEGERIKR